MKQLNDKDIEAISVLTIDSRRPETIGLIKKHGINLPMNAPTQMVDKAFLSLAKQNSNFRADFSALAHDTSLSFTGSNEGNWFNGDGKGVVGSLVKNSFFTNKPKVMTYTPDAGGTTLTGQGYKSKSITAIPYGRPKSPYKPSRGGSAILPFTGSNEGDFFNASASQLSRQAGGATAVKVGTTNPALATDTTTEKKGGFWSYLSDVFTPDTTRDILNTALNIWSVKQTGQNAATTQNNLDQARFDLQESGGTTATQGMGVGTIILISVGALALIGGIIYFVRKK
jgi:hypothetical protein